MGGADEEWVKAAMSDDTMVVELLVRLHGAAAAPSPPARLEWSIRQRRSRSVSANTKKLRASPSTPLWWSGGTSLSGGSEESTRRHSQKLSTDARSKLNGDSEKAVSKKSRKKKTLTELKDEENSLLKERRDLKREIAALRLNLEKQIANNEKLKRIKMELQPQLDRDLPPAIEDSVSDNRLQHKTTTCHPIPPIMPPLIPVGAMAPRNADGAAFVLPDLNMPFEDPCPDIICSVS